MGKIMILLIDDDEIVLVGWQRELESSGFTVRTAESGSRAIEIAKEEKPAVVITDLVMPNMNGVEVCKKIKEMHPDSQVVLISGHPEEIKRNQIDFVRAGGREEFLRKPLLDNELIEVVNKVIKERQ